MSASLQRIIDIHSSETKSSTDTINLDYYIDKYRRLNNELTYILDCRTSDLQVINNVEDAVFKTRGFKIKNVSDLFTQVHDSHLKKYTDLSLGMCRSWAEGHVKFLPAATAETDTTLSIYKSKLGEKIMRKTYCLLSDHDGNITHTVGHLSNVTHLFKTDQVRYQFNGPNEKVLYGYVNELLEFSKPLSKRELLILNLIGKGMNSTTISEQLFISKHTVNTHRKNIIKKLEVNSSIQAYNKAADMGLFKV